MSVDGLWIDMNEPSNFCNGECKGLLRTNKVFISNSTKPLSARLSQTLTDPPYCIDNQNNKAPLNTKTVDPDAVQYGTTHYNAHNLFGMFIHRLNSASVHIVNDITNDCRALDYMYVIIIDEN